VPEHMVGKI